jgi:DNA repair and recombination protein RAD52
MTFKPEQIKALQAPLDRSRVATRAQAGRELSYIEGWWAIAEANRIFGFDAWSRETLELKQLGEPREVDGKFRVAYMARVRIVVETEGRTAIVREGCGYGSGIDKDLGQAHESALKEAETDAMKRGLMTFGNPFGLALYDKTQSNVASLPTRKSAAQAKRDGDDVRIKAEIEACPTELDLNRWYADFDKHTANVPASWLDPIRDMVESRRNDIIEQLHNERAA